VEVVEPNTSKNQVFVSSFTWIVWSYF